MATETGGPTAGVGQLCNRPLPNCATLESRDTASSLVFVLWGPHLGYRELAGPELIVQRLGDSCPYSKSGNSLTGTRT